MVKLIWKSFYYSMSDICLKKWLKIHKFRVKFTDIEVKKLVEEI